MAGPEPFIQLSYEASRLRALHDRAWVRAESPPWMPPGAWLGDAAGAYEQQASLLAASLHTALLAIRDARDVAARELAHALG